MAEATGLVMGAVSLAGLITNCIECFKYIRIGRGLEDEFAIYQTELDVLELRLSRWAQAVMSVSGAQSPAISDEVAPLIKKILKQMVKLFQRAREDVEEYTDSGDRRIQPLDPCEASKLKTVHLRLKHIIDCRQTAARINGLAGKARWAMYKREDFVALIVNLRTKVNDLEALMPIAELKQRLEQMRSDDAAEVRKEAAEEIELVELCTEKVDPAFGRVLEQLRTGHSYNKTEVGNYSEVQMGDTIAKGYIGPLLGTHHSFNETRTGRGSRVSMGNLHGRSVFDRSY